MKAHKSAEQHAIEAVKANTTSNELIVSQFLAAQGDASVHAKRNHRVTLSGIILTVTISLVSVVITCYGLRSQSREAPASIAYQKQMQDITQRQLLAVQQQKEAVDRLSQVLIDTQKKAAVAQQRAVETAAAELSRRQ